MTKASAWVALVMLTVVVLVVLGGITVHTGSPYAPLRGAFG